MEDTPQVVDLDIHTVVAVVVVPRTVAAAGGQGSQTVVELEVEVHFPARRRQEASKKSEIENKNIKELAPKLSLLGG